MSEAAIDSVAFAELTEAVGADFIGQLLATFFRDAPLQIATMRAALVNADGAVFERAAHSLKSNAASFGATRLAGLARELELMGRERCLAGMDDKLSALATEYDGAARALTELQAAVTAGGATGG
jgi:HPt (histidine-containing phosphotransfer) domain-containing protein